MKSRFNPYPLATIALLLLSLSIYLLDSPYPIAFSPEKTEGNRTTVHPSLVQDVGWVFNRGSGGGFLGIRGRIQSRRAARSAAASSYGNGCSASYAQSNCPNCPPQYLPASAYGPATYPAGVVEINSLQPGSEVVTEYECFTNQFGQKVCRPKSTTVKKPSASEPPVAPTNVEKVDQAPVNNAPPGVYQSPANDPPGSGVRSKEPPTKPTAGESFTSAEVACFRCGNPYCRCLDCPGPNCKCPPYANRIASNAQSFTYTHRIVVK